jgi:hypothetical protein
LGPAVHCPPNAWFNKMQSTTLQQRHIVCPRCGKKMKFELSIPYMDGTGDYCDFYSCPAGHPHSERRKPVEQK